jgi:hypothetical protein
MLTKARAGQSDVANSLAQRVRLGESMVLDGWIAGGKRRGVQCLGHSPVVSQLARQRRRLGRRVLCVGAKPWLLTRHGLNGSVAVSASISNASASSVESPVVRASSVALRAKRTAPS